MLIVLGTSYFLHLQQTIVGRVLGPNSIPASRLLDYSNPNDEWYAAKKAVLAVRPECKGALDRPFLTLSSWIDGVCLADMKGGVFTPSLLKQIGALCLVDAW